MNNRSDTLHRIRRAKNNVKDLNNGMFMVATKSPFALSVLKEERALQQIEIEQLESLAKRMGWKLEE